MMWRIDVLPDPDGPNSAMILPDSTVMVTSSAPMAPRPYLLETWRSSSLAALPLQEDSFVDYLGRHPVTEHRLSDQLLRQRDSAIAAHVQLSAEPGATVDPEHPVLEMQHTVGPRSQCNVVGHRHHGETTFVAQAGEEAVHLKRSLCVEVARRVAGQGRAGGG